MTKVIKRVLFVAAVATVLATKNVSAASSTLPLRRMENCVDATPVTRHDEKALAYDVSSPGADVIGVHRGDNAEGSAAEPKTLTDNDASGSGSAKFESIQVYPPWFFDPV